ncbi:serine protease SP24D [Zeugodacus cucurbitae]|uniref:Serine protease SP24D n=1 Tax=Zeugodacus cucurbitae TaxID=28588 RepID=A0A0A1XGL0_ZEUCU|nr:serine protease SP24D [Zeugodacus cucurbitae]
MKRIVSALLLSILLAASQAAPSQPEARIVGGDDVEPGQLPYQGFLTIGGTATCGVSILSERYALTALTCICSSGSNRPWPPQLFSVTAGTVELYRGGVKIVVEEITLNPNYSSLDTGIALLKLKEPFVFSDKIQPIALSAVEPPLNAEVEISGWGRIKQTEENLYRTLQINEAVVVDTQECATLTDKVEEQVLCLRSPRKNGICRGDFGGPAVYEGKLVGMSAYVLGDCGSMLPDVFVSIASNYDWIQAQIAM